jgi:hypothetical protein
MLESFRNVGRILIIALFTYWGVALFIGAVTAISLLTYDLFVLGDFNQFLTHLFGAGMIVAVVFGFFWMSHDANAEVKSIQLQKQELLEKEPTSAPPPDVSPREPWLFP